MSHANGRKKRERVFGNSFGRLIYASRDLLDRPEQGKVYFEIRPLTRLADILFFTVRTHRPP